VTNIFAWRDTDPKRMRASADPVGPENDAAIVAGCHWADTIICAWGTHGAFNGRGRDVANLMAGSGKIICHLGLTKDGYPKHPLYISYAQEPVKWDRSDMANDHLNR